MEFAVDQAVEPAENDIAYQQSLSRYSPEEGKMPQRSTIELRLAVMKRRLAMIRKALKQEEASLLQARKELGLSKKKALPKRKGVPHAATK
jgi:hypothetical protein